MVLKLFSQSVFVLAICVVSFAFEKFFFVFYFCIVKYINLPLQLLNTIPYISSEDICCRIILHLLSLSSPLHRLSEVLDEIDPFLSSEPPPSLRVRAVAASTAPQWAPFPLPPPPSVLHKAPRAASAKQESHLTQLRSSGDAPPLALGTEPALLRRALLSVLSFPDFTPAPPCPRPAHLPGQRRASSEVTWRGSGHRDRRGIGASQVPSDSQRTSADGDCWKCRPRFHGTFG